jgi:hypothetical protein
MDIDEISLVLNKNVFTKFDKRYIINQKKGEKINE